MPINIVGKMKAQAEPEYYDHQKLLRTSNHTWEQLLGHCS